MFWYYVLVCFLLVGTGAALAAKERDGQWAFIMAGFCLVPAVLYGLANGLDSMTKLAFVTGAALLFVGWAAPRMKL